MGQQWIVYVEETRYGAILVDEDDVPGADLARNWETFEFLVRERAAVLLDARQVTWGSLETTWSSPITPERDAHERRRAGSSTLFPLPGGLNRPHDSGNPADATEG